MSKCLWLIPHARFLFTSFRGAGFAGTLACNRYHLGSKSLSVWEETDLMPDGDRESNWYNVADHTEDGDIINTCNVRAAPTNQLYSVFHDPTLERLQGMILKRGRGDLAYSLMNDTLRQIKLIQLSKFHGQRESSEEVIETNPLVIIHQAIQNATPAMGLQHTVKAGAAFAVPCPLSEKKKFFLTANWFLSHVRGGKPKNRMSERLAKEILLAYENAGVAVKRKQDLHRQVISSRAYIHLRWDG